MRGDAEARRIACQRTFRRSGGLLGRAVGLPGIHASGQFRRRDYAGSEGLSHGRYPHAIRIVVRPALGAANTGAGRPLLKSGAACAGGLPRTNVARIGVFEKTTTATI